MADRTKRPTTTPLGNLILTRQRGQTIKLGDDISITVEEIRKDKVRLAISAPKSLTVHRLEVYQDIQINGARGT